MAGYQTILKYRQLESDLDQLGFVMGSPGMSWSGEDLVTIRPKGPDSLPIYSRDAEIFTGSLAELRTWVQGVQWARHYDELNQVSNPRRRERREQLVRNGQLMTRLRQPEKSQIAR